MQHSYSSFAADLLDSLRAQQPVSWQGRATPHAGRMSLMPRMKRPINMPRACACQTVLRQVVQQTDHQRCFSAALR